MEYEETYHGQRIIVTTLQQPKGDWKSKAELLDFGNRVLLGKTSDERYSSEEEAKRAAHGLFVGALEDAKIGIGPGTHRGLFRAAHTNIAVVPGDHRLHVDEFPAVVAETVEFRDQGARIILGCGVDVREHVDQLALLGVDFGGQKRGVVLPLGHR